MIHNPLLDADPSARLKLARRLDILALVLASGYLALVLWGDTPRIVSRGFSVALICFVLARVAIQGGRPAPVRVTGQRAAGYLILAAACVLAVVVLFPVGSWGYQVLLMAVIPLTLGIGEFFRWRARSRSA